MKGYRRKGRRNVNLAFVRFVIGAAVVGALMFAVIACDGTGSPTSRPEPPSRPTVPSFAGNYGATAGRTAVNLEVTEDSFTAVIYTKWETNQFWRSFSVFTGDVTTSGSAVTLSVEDVYDGGFPHAERDALGQCSIAATAGATFANEIMSDIVECLGTTDETATVYEYRDGNRPSDLVIGTWSLDVTGDKTFVDYTLRLTSTELIINYAMSSVEGAITRLELAVNISSISNTGVSGMFRDGWMQIDDGERIPITRDTTGLDAMGIKFGEDGLDGVIHFVVDSSGGTIAVSPRIGIAGIVLVRQT